jgi:ABC-type glycerol-3-phosphate transport system substrate-binding protein
MATVSGTPPVIPEEIPPVPAVTPPPPGSLVRIWVSWSPEQIRALDDMIDAFQDVYPGIRFDVTNFPQADLRRRYETAAYNGGGPSLLLAPAEWGPAYYESGLVRDLSPYTADQFMAGINPAALGTGWYQGALISLPVSQKGVVLFRNTALISTEAETFDELIAAARGATRAGNLGAYFDRGAFFSAGNLGGLGGAMMDASQNPLFNSLAGLAWLDLLEAYDTAGAVGLNTNRDLELFRAGRIGYIIEGTWQINSLVLALGEENLAIDPWPAFETGHLSGFVQADSIFLNPNAKSGDMYAAMLFMGYLLTPDVQQYLAEIGMIPVSLDADPRLLHIAQAANALAGGTAYPPVANTRVLTAYWEGLELAIQAVFTRRIEPQDALNRAEDLVLERLSELSH